MKKLTITDIAKKAEVSKTTVSHVLNNTGYVGEKTRDKIEKIIKLYNYSPSPIARAIKTKKTKSIGFLTEFLRHQVTTEIIYSIEKTILNMGYVLNIFNIEEDLNNEFKILDLIGNRRIDGIITAGASKNLVMQISNNNIPAVNLDMYKDLKNNTYVSIDNYKGGEIAAECLIKHNHKKVGIILNESKTIDHFVMREKGFKDAFKKKNLDILFSIPITLKIDSIREEIEKNQDILINHDLTAIFTTTDLTAFYLLEFFRENGIKVPEDISIIGFDNIFFSSLTYPKLTTIEYDYRLAAKLAAENLIHKIEKGNYKRNETIIEPNLIERDSVISIK